jgi:hypothetical protein
MFSSQLIAIQIFPLHPQCLIISLLFYGEQQYKIAPEMVTYMYYSNFLPHKPTPSPTVTWVPTTPVPSPQPTATFKPTESTWDKVRLGARVEI